MPLYICTDHDSRYAISAAAIVLADTEDEARALLDKELMEHGLQPYGLSPYTLEIIDPYKSQAIILRERG